MKFYCLCILLMTLLSCVKVTVKDLSGNVPISPGSTSWRLNAELTDSNYPLTLNFSGIKSADQIYIMTDADQNCNGGETIGFDFAMSEGSLTSNFKPSELSGSVRILVINGSERICLNPLSFNLQPRFNPRAMVREIPNPAFNVVSTAEVGTMRMTRGMPSPSYDHINNVITQASPLSIITGGDSHSCSVQVDGKVNCWGDNGFGQLGNNSTTDSLVPVEVQGISGAVGIALGVLHSCALLNDGKVNCWGQNYFGQLGNNSTTNSLVPVEVQGISNAVAIAFKGYKSCALLSSGKVNCWGENSFGGLGNNSTINSLVPVEVQGISDAVGIADSCALLSNGKVNCWGQNYFGQLGNNSTTNSLVPVEVQGISSAVEIAYGQSHTCALLNDGKVNCWGNNNGGRLGNNSTTNSLVPVEVQGISDAVGIALGNNHSCALLTSGKVNCWGGNFIRQLGNNSTTDSLVPVEVQGISDAVGIGVGGHHSCALLTNGKVNCWGHNFYGQLGNNSTSSSFVPTSALLPYGEVITGEIITSSPLSTIAPRGLEGNHSCAILSNGKVNCWGGNGDGQLGNNSTARSLDPVEVQGISNAVGIALGSRHSCALLSSGKVNCWGSNDYGRLGNNSTTNSLVPVEVQGISSAVGLALGVRHSCALLTSGKVNCWGFNATGQLGNNSTTDSLVPVEVQGISGVVGIALGGIHSCAILSNGKVNCWGNNGSGQLGNNSTARSLDPVEVQGVSSVVGIALGSNHSCAILSNGKVNCWGGNGDGQLGNNSTTNSLVPVEVQAISDAEGIALGGSHSCALLSTGRVNCWGYNRDGQLGNNSTTNSLVPVEVQGISDAEGIALGSTYSCALNSNREQKCWGHQSISSKFKSLKSLGVVKDIAEANGTICLAFETGVQCAGYGRALGFEPDEPFLVYTFNETQVIPLSNIQKLSAGGSHFCGKNAQNKLNCWGENGSGQLGVGNSNEYFEPQEILSDVLDFAMTSDSTCAVTLDGKLYCWGSGFTQSPQQVMGLENIESVWSNQYGSQLCAIDSAKKVYCIGDNSSGSLGVDPNVQNYFYNFEEASSLAGATKIAITYSHSCGIYGTTKEIKCWGENGLGQLGVDPMTVNASYSPVATSIVNASDIFMDYYNNRTLFLQNQKVFGLGVNGDYLPFLYALGGLNKVVLSASSGIFYGQMRSEDFVIYNPDLLDEMYFANLHLDTVR